MQLFRDGVQSFLWDTSKKLQRFCSGMKLDHLGATISALAKAAPVADFEAQDRFGKTLN
jgi:hypothetical protein